MNEIYQEIQALKQERRAVILAHYYVPEEVQACADYIGDSFYLSRIAVSLEAETIVFAGVSFMGESAKILNPDKTVLMPEPSADCPMAHMASPEKIRAMREKYPDLAVVCYINSTAELKAASDICVTSANAVKIVKSLPNQNIYFIPDENLGTYVAEQVPEKNIILNDGYCVIHKNVTTNQVQEAARLHPEAEILVHPECKKEVTALADYVGSTSGIIQYAAKSDKKEFIVVTENGVFYELEKSAPGKAFYPVTGGQCCPGMKTITLEKLRDCLKNRTGEVFVSDSVREACILPLERMLEAGK